MAAVEANGTFELVEVFNPKVDAEERFPVQSGGSGGWRFGRGF